MVRFPLKVILEAPVNVREVPVLILLVKLPDTVKSVAGMVFTAAPLDADRVRLPYVSAATVWLVPSYSTVLVRLRDTVA